MPALRRHQPPITSSESEDPGPLGWLVIGLVCVFVWSRCCCYFFDAYEQYHASAYPSAWGQVTKYKWEEFGMVESELVVSYTYIVNGTRYFGSQKRFAPRQFRSQSPAAIALARSWGTGARVKVFYQPSNPANAALDNLFTRGDWKTLGGAMIGFLITSAVMIGSVVQFLSRYHRMRKLQVSRDIQLQSLGC